MIKFGAFTDLHYAKNITNGNRKCNLSLLKLQNIVKDFNNRKLDFCLCLGDIINSVQDFNTDKLNIQRISEGFSKFNMPNHIILGNHDIESMSKNDFYNIFGKKINSTYYSFTYESSKFIILDANYLSDNSNYYKGNYSWDDSYICKEQILWLEKEIEDCSQKNIFIFTHQNLGHKIYMGKTDPHLIKNYKEVVQILEKYNRKITVIQGHYHDGDYQVINNIIYITLKAVCTGNDILYNPRIIVTIDKNVSIEYLE